MCVMMPCSASCTWTTCPNSVGRCALPRLRICVAGSKILTLFPSVCVLPDTRLRLRDDLASQQCKVLQRLRDTPNGSWSFAMHSFAAAHHALRLPNHTSRRGEKVRVRLSQRASLGIAGQGTSRNLSNLSLAPTNASLRKPRGAATPKNRNFSILRHRTWVVSSHSRESRG